MGIGRSWCVVVLGSLLSCWGIAGADDTDDLIKKITAQTRLRAEAAVKLLAAAESLGDLPEAHLGKKPQ